jgi:hypothetical protein
MVESRSLFQKNAPKTSAEVDKFLESIRAGSKGGGSGRLIFALDATASRKPTWDLAAKLQAQMFQEVATIGGLSLQLVYYRGLGECKASGWVSESSRLLRLMERIDCRTGTTQIKRVLTHAANEATKQPVAALVFVGDAIEENPDVLSKGARSLRQLKTPCFMFQEGQDPTVEAAFRAVADHSGGAYARFDSASGKQLGDLLRAAALFAIGGAAALAGRKDSGSTLLIEQLKGR